MRSRHIVLLAILIMYAVLGFLFAVRTPAWQAPDEPAHYNYVRFVATTGGFPVLQMGDYPHGYLEEIKSRKFPPELSIEPIRYEFHQPPLYYGLLAPIYRLTGGALLPLRLTSVLLGAGVVLLAYAIARRAMPGRPQVALGTAAFVAFLPQHLATVAQVGNDVLAELLFAAVLYLMVEWLHPNGQARRADRSVFAVGVLLGLILATKTTAYIALPLVAGVLLWRWRRERADWRRIGRETLSVIVPLLVIGLPWFARNLTMYGWPDFLGLIRHDQIVVGQMRTEEFLARFGWAAYGRRAIEFTYKSFWGVFGWLGVFMDSRVYFLTVLLSGVAAGGLILAASHSTCEASRRRVAIFLLCSTLLTFVAYAWYNVQFVQHQGRYLFTALIPLALAFAAGWETATTPRAGRYLAAALGIFAVALALWGVISRTGLPKWPLALTLVMAWGMAKADYGPMVAERFWRRPLPALPLLMFAAPFGILPLLALYGLFAAIVPQLAR